MKDKDFAKSVPRDIAVVARRLLHLEKLYDELERKQSQHGDELTRLVKSGRIRGMGNGDA